MEFSENGTFQELGHPGRASDSCPSQTRLREAAAAARSIAKVERKTEFVAKPMEGALANSQSTLYESGFAATSKNTTL